MSLVISNISLHFLSVQEETGTINVRFGPENIEHDSKIEKFVDGMHKIYNGKGNKAYGRFSEQVAENGNARFVDMMESYFTDQQSFYQFSVQAANTLKAEIEKYGLHETGYLLNCHYEYMGGRYLLIAIIPVSEHYSVDQALNISADKHLDTDKIQLAARIDLFEHQQNPQSNRYISFIKGRAGRKVSDFFLDFLACEEGLDAKQQSQTLVQAVEDFVNVNQLDQDEKQQTRKELQNYCKEQKSAGEDVLLKEVAELFTAEQPEQDFYSFCQNQGYELEEKFPHDQAVINKATKYSGYGNGISVSFDRNHFGQDVVYDANADTLTIYKVPPNLKDQLIALLNEQTAD
jgi:nucleoid-associated protein